MLSALDDLQLEGVVGGNGWDAMDNGLSKVSKGWREDSCAARGSWVGWGYGTAVGAAQWAIFAKLNKQGPKAQAMSQAALGSASSFIGTKVYASYMNHCEKTQGK